MNLDTLITLLGLLFTVIVTVAAVTWRIGLLRVELLTAIHTIRREVDIDLALVRKDITDFKLEVERTYIAKSSFFAYMDRFGTQLVAGMDKMMARLDKVEALLTTLSDRVTRTLARRRASGEQE